MGWYNLKFYTEPTDLQERTLSPPLTSISVDIHESVGQGPEQQEGEDVAAEACEHEAHQVSVGEPLRVESHVEDEDGQGGRCLHEDEGEEAL